jgi:hypothetical protein
MALLASSETLKVADLQPFSITVAGKPLLRGSSVDCVTSACRKHPPYSDRMLTSAIDFSAILWAYTVQEFR